MITALSLFGGFCSGFGVKHVINWLSIDGYRINKNNYSLEFLNGLAWIWAFSNLSLTEAGIFSLLFSILAGIALVDYMTFQIPLVFILAGIVLAIAGIAFKVIFLTAAIWGIFVGAGLWRYSAWFCSWCLAGTHENGYNSFHCICVKFINVDSRFTYNRFR